MAAWRYEISLLVLKKYFTRSLRLLVKCFSTLAEKFRISARPCNILYIFLKKGNCSHLQCVPVQLFNVVIYAADINILEDSFDFLMMFLLETLVFTFVDEKLASCHVSIVTISQITYQVL